MKARSSFDNLMIIVELSKYAYFQLMVLLLIFMVCANKIYKKKALWVKNILN